MLAPRRVVAALVVALIMAVLPSIATAAVMISTSVGTTDYPLGGAPVAVDPGFAVWDDANHPTAAWIDYVTVVASPGDTLQYPAGDYACSSGFDFIRGSSSAPHQVVLTIVNPINGCTAADWQSRLRLITFSTSSASPATRSVAFEALSNDDGTLATDAKTVSVSSPPAVTLPASTTFTEDSSPVALAPTATVSYSSGATLTGATVQITGNYEREVSSGLAWDALALGSNPAPGTISASFDDVSGTLTLTGTASVAVYQQALRAVTFQNTSNSPSTAQRTVRFTVSDGSSTGSADMAVNVVAVNDPPILAGVSGTVTYTEGGSAVALAGAMTLADADDVNLSSATVSITGNFAAGQDVLSVGTPGGLVTSYDPSTGVLTLSGSASKATYRTALRSVRYSNSSENPSTTQRTMTFAIHDGVSSSAPGTSYVNVVAVNDAPVVTTSGGTTAFTEAGAAVAVDSALTITDADSVTLASATAAITANFASGQDVLAFGNNGSTMGNVVGSWNASTGILTLTSAGGTATAAQWQAALRAVTFSNSSSAPSTAARTVAFTVNDGIGNSPASTKDLTVTAVNSAPSVTTSGGTAAFVEDAGAVAVDPGVVADDPDSTLGSATVSISGNFSSGQDVLAFTNDGSTMGSVVASYNASTGVLTLTPSSATSNSEWSNALRAVTYANTSQAPSTATRTVSFVVNDGTSNSPAATRAVSVTAAADSPIVYITGFTLSAHEQVATPVDDGIQVTDPDVTGITDAQVLVSSGFVPGQDVLGFTSNGSTMGNITGSYDADSGVLAMSSAGGTATNTQWRTALRAVTYLNTSNTPDVGLRAITVRVRDGDARPWVSATRPLQVAAVNDAPSWSAITVAIPMDDAWVFGSTTDLSFLYSDPEATPLAQVKVTSVGAWGSLRDCNGPLALPATVSAANFMGSGPCPLRFVPVAGEIGSNEIDLEVFDGQAWSAPSHLTLAATATPPQVAVEGGAITVPAGTSAVVGTGLALGSTLATELPEGAVRVASGGAPGDSLGISLDAASPGNILSIGTDPLALDLVSVGTVASPAQWQAALRTVTFQAGATPGTRTITFEVGNGLATTQASVVVRVPEPNPPAGDGGAAARAPSPPAASAPAKPSVPLTPAGRARAAFSAAIARATVARTAALAACARRPAAARAACRSAAARTYARTVALATAVRTRDLALAQCAAKKAAAKAACTASARARYTRDRARAAGSGP